MPNEWAALVLIIALAACSPLKLLGGGGPNVAANGQMGATNAQTIGRTEVSEQRITGSTAREIRQSTSTNQVSAEKVDTVIVHQYPAWLILAFATALFLDSPLRWPEQIVSGLRRRGKV